MSTINKNYNIPASYLILLKDNQVLLMRRQNTGYEDNNYCFIAGHVEPNETFTEAAIREGKEEVGVILKPEDVKVVHVMHRKSHDGSERVNVFFLAQKWEGEPKNLEPEKCDDLAWFALGNLPQNTIPYISLVLKYMRKKVFYSEYGWKETVSRAQLLT